MQFLYILQVQTIETALLDLFIIKASCKNVVNLIPICGNQLLSSRFGENTIAALRSVFHHTVSKIL